jgi:gamma-glutamyltranspeptidase/glutathione hydrolase
MGGDMQPQGHVQILVNMIDFGLNVQQAGDAGRVEHKGSATPTGLPMEKKGGTVAVESNFPPDVLRELRNRGHQVTKSTSGPGGYQGILIDWKNGTLQGATEPRKDGAVLGY